MADCKKRMKNFNRAHDFGFSASSHNISYVKFYILPKPVIPEQIRLNGTLQ